MNRIIIIQLTSHQTYQLQELHVRQRHVWSHVSRVSVLKKFEWSLSDKKVFQGNGCWPHVTNGNVQSLKRPEEVSCCFMDNFLTWSSFCQSESLLQSTMAPVTTLMTASSPAPACHWSASEIPASDWLLLVILPDPGSRSSSSPRAGRSNPHS